MKKSLPLIIGTVVLSACGSTSFQDDLVQKAPQTTSGENPGKRNTVDVAYMDKSIRPSDDFFQFANGTWCKNNPVPASESRWGSFNELDQRNKTTLTALLQDAQRNNSVKGSQNQLLGDYFTAFSDMAKRNDLGNKPLNTRLEAIRTLKSKDEISRILAEQHKVGIRSGFSFGVGQDLKNVSKNAAYIGQSGLGLPSKEYYFADNKASIREAYKKYVAEIFMLLGEKEESAAKKAEIVMSFETKLAGSMMAPAEMRAPEKTYNKYDFKTAKKLFPLFDFDGYLMKLGSQTFDTLIVSQPKFLENFNEMMNTNTIEDWQTYLTFKTANHYSGALDEKCVNARFKFYSGVLSGKTEMKPINERAIDELTGSPLGELLGKAFVEKSFSKNAQLRVNKMVDDLLASFTDRIKGLDWMSDSTKTEALLKLNSIGRKLGFPDEWRNFNSLTIKYDDYIGNLDNCALFETKEELGKLYKPVNRKEWGMPAHMVNAYYHPLLNEIAFPAGIMQPPFFDENAEDAVNYGRIGMVIGHEFTHGFDDMGSKFAADGSFTNWWKPTDRSLFEQRTKTLGETYSAFCPLSDNCVNSELTMGENIADLGGLTMAYYAYKRTDEYKSGQKIEGFTPDQRFFIAYAQLWKINYTEAELKNRIANDSHSPGMYRVNGPLKNCPEFFEAFSVKEGDKMRNPTGKVAKIW